jgi:hypothetical protein
VCKAVKPSSSLHDERAFTRLFTIVVEKSGEVGGPLAENEATDVHGFAKSLIAEVAEKRRGERKEELGQVRGLGKKEKAVILVML